MRSSAPHQHERRQHERRLDPFGLAALAASGTLTAHQIGYLVDGEARAAHTYFSVLGPLVLLAACVAAWSAAVRILRRVEGRAPTLLQLSGVQIALFAAMEVAERMSAGAFSSLNSLPVLFGLAAQPLVAWAALRALAVGRRIVRFFAAPSAPERPIARSLHAVAPNPVIVAVRRASIRLRGPPDVVIAQITTI